MNNYVLFIRGINVAGKNKVNMRLLKDFLANHGYDEVKTYLNTGNIIIKSDSKENLKKDMKNIIKNNFKIDVDIIIKSKDELNDIIKNNPFNSENESEGSKRVIVLLSEKLIDTKIQLLKKDINTKEIEENYYIINDVLFIYYHNGIGRSKFTNNYIEKKLDLIATSRNWNTINKIISMF